MKCQLRRLGCAQCEYSNDLHFLAAEVLYPELIHPETTEPLPIAPEQKQPPTSNRFNLSPILVMGQGKSVIGAIHGWAVGGGFEWLLNIRLRAVRAQHNMLFPEIQLGSPAG